MKKIDHMTLEQLEGDLWPEPDFPSYLLRTSHLLRKKKLGEFSVEDLRIMLGQSIGANYLLPKALGVLEENPLACGDFFEGDLLVAIARHPEYSAIMTSEERLRWDTICRAAINSTDPVLSKKDLRAVKSFLAALDS